MKNIFLITAIFCLTFSGIKAQNNFETWRKQSNKDFDNYKSKREQEFQDYRAKANADFAEFMEQSWKRFNAFKGIPAPKLPDPVKPPVVEPEKKPTTDLLPFGAITPIPIPTPRPQPLSPIRPIPVTPEPAKSGFSFLFSEFLTSYPYPVE